MFHNPSLYSYHRRPKRNIAPLILQLILLLISFPNILTSNCQETKCVKCVKPRTSPDPMCTACSNSIISTSGTTCVGIKSFPNCAISKLDPTSKTPVCTVCEAGFHLNKATSPPICMRLPSPIVNCLTSRTQDSLSIPTICLLCLEGFFPSPNLQSCMKPPSTQIPSPLITNCKIHSRKGSSGDLSCYFCKEGFSLVSNAFGVPDTDNCVPSSTIVLGCRVLSEDKKYCIECDPSLGFFETDSTPQINDSDPSKINYFQQKKKCYRGIIYTKIKPILRISSKNGCDGFYCVDCIRGITNKPIICRACLNSSLKVFQFSSDTPEFLTGVCIPEIAITNCEIHGRIPSSSTPTCLMCSSNFYFDTPTQKCIQSIQKKCLYPKSGTECQICVQGWLPTSTGVCILGLESGSSGATPLNTKIKFCRLHIFKNSKIECEECIAAHHFINNDRLVCHPSYSGSSISSLISCKAAENGICMECNSGYGFFPNRKYQTEDFSCVYRAGEVKYSNFQPRGGLESGGIESSINFSGMNFCEDKNCIKCKFFPNSNIQSCVTCLGKKLKAVPGRSSETSCSRDEDSPNRRDPAYFGEGILSENIYCQSGFVQTISGTGVSCTMVATDISGCVDYSSGGKCLFCRNEQQPSATEDSCEDVVSGKKITGCMYYLKPLSSNGNAQCYHCKEGFALVIDTSNGVINYSACVEVGSDEGIACRVQFADGKCHECSFQLGYFENSSQILAGTSGTTVLEVKTCSLTRHTLNRFLDKPSTITNSRCSLDFAITCLGDTESPDQCLNSFVVDDPSSSDDTHAQCSGSSENDLLSSPSNSLLPDCIVSVREKTLQASKANNKCVTCRPGFKFIRNSSSQYVCSINSKEQDKICFNYESLAPDRCLLCDERTKDFDSEFNRVNPCIIKIKDSLSIQDSQNEYCRYNTLAISGAVCEQCYGQFYVDTDSGNCIPFGFLGMRTSTMDARFEELSLGFTDTTDQCSILNGYFAKSGPDSLTCELGTRNKFMVPLSTNIGDCSLGCLDCRKLSSSEYCTRCSHSVLMGGIPEQSGYCSRKVSLESLLPSCIASTRTPLGALICLDCKPGLSLSLTENTCTVNNPIPQCKSQWFIKDSNQLKICRMCESGFYLNPQNDQCLPVSKTIPHCKYYSLESLCESCQIGYVLIYDGSKIDREKCVQNSSLSHCMTVNKDKNSCKRCNIYDGFFEIDYKISTENIRGGDPLNYKIWEERKCSLGQWDYFGSKVNEERSQNGIISEGEGCGNYCSNCLEAGLHTSGISLDSRRFEYCTSCFGGFELQGSIPYSRCVAPEVKEGQTATESKSQNWEKFSNLKNCVEASLTKVATPTNPAIAHKQVQCSLAARGYFLSEDNASQVRSVVEPTSVIQDCWVYESLTKCKVCAPGKIAKIPSQDACEEAAGINIIQNCNIYSTSPSTTSGGGGGSTQIICLSCSTNYLLTSPLQCTTATNPQNKGCMSLLPGLSKHCARCDYFKGYYEKYAPDSSNSKIIRKVCVKTPYSIFGDFLEDAGTSSCTQPEKCLDCSIDASGTPFCKECYQNQLIYNYPSNKGRCSSKTISLKDCLTTKMSGNGVICSLCKVGYYFDKRIGECMKILITGCIELEEDQSTPGSYICKLCEVDLTPSQDSKICLPLPSHSKIQNCLFYKRKQSDPTKLECRSCQDGYTFKASLPAGVTSQPTTDYSACLEEVPQLVGCQTTLFKVTSGTPTQDICLKCNVLLSYIEIKAEIPILGRPQIQHKSCKLSNFPEPLYNVLKRKRKSSTPVEGSCNSQSCIECNLKGKISYCSKCAYKPLLISTDALSGRCEGIIGIPHCISSVIDVRVEGTEKCQTCSKSYYLDHDTGMCVKHILVGCHQAVIDTNGVIRCVMCSENRKLNVKTNRCDIFGVDTLIPNCLIHVNYGGKDYCAACKQGYTLRLKGNGFPDDSRCVLEVRQMNRGCLLVDGVGHCLSCNIYIGFYEGSSQAIIQGQGDHSYSQVKGCFKGLKVYLSD